MVARLTAVVVATGFGWSAPCADRLRRERGQAFAEYVLLLALVGVAVALVIQGDFTNALRTALQRVGGVLESSGR